MRHWQKGVKRLLDKFSPAAHTRFSLIFHTKQMQTQAAQLGQLNNHPFKVGMILDLKVAYAMPTVLWGFWQGTGSSSWKEITNYKSKFSIFGEKVIALIQGARTCIFFNKGNALRLGLRLNLLVSKSSSEAVNVFCNLGEERTGADNCLLTEFSIFNKTCSIVASLCYFQWLRLRYLNRK